MPTMTLQQLLEAKIVTVKDEFGEVVKVIFPSGLKVGLDSPIAPTAGIEFPSKDAPSDTTNLLYNENGTIKFNGASIAGGGGGSTLEGIDDQSSSNDDQITITDSAVIINEDSDDVDFRIESNGNTHAFFIDGADNTIAAGGIDATNHKDGFAVFNDFNGTTFGDTLTDGQFGSAEVLRYSPGADDTLTTGQIYYLHTDGTWNSADADAASSGGSQLLGVGLGGAARTVGALLRGFIRIPSTEILNTPGSGAVDGLPLYISTTAGHFDFTAPSSTGDIVRVVGYAIDDASSDVLVYFDPDKTWVELT
jgi:hypothetical protein